MGDLGYAQPWGWFKLADFLGVEKSFSTIGNHNVANIDVYLKYYDLENEFYSFNFKNIHFISLFTESSFQKKSA